MPDVMGRTHPILLLAATLALAGCTFLFDPDVCESDDDCDRAGATCTDNVCVGGEAPTPDPEAGSGGAGGEDAADATPPPADVAPPADMAPDALLPDVPIVYEPPACEIVSPVADLPAPDLLTADDRITVMLRVSDPDSALADLVVTLNGEAVTLDAGGEASVDVELQQGLNRIRLDASDEGDRGCSVERTVEVDSAAPEIALDDVCGDNTCNMQEGCDVALSGTVRDANQGDCAVTLNGDAVGAADVGLDGNRLTVNVSFEDGDNSVSIVCTDALGNASAAQMLEVVCDEQPPSCDLTSPTDDQLLATTDVDVTGRVSDDGPLNLVQVRLTLGADTLRPPLIDGQFTTQFQGVADGIHRVECIVTDRAGNVAQDSANFTVNTLAVPVTIDAPVDGTCVAAGQGVEICGSFDGMVQGVAVNGAEAVLDVIAGTYCANIDLPMGPGPHTVQAEATSVGGLRSQSNAVELRVDGSPPEIQDSIPFTPPSGCLNEPGLCDRARNPEGCGAQPVRFCFQVSDDGCGVAEVMINDQVAVQQGDSYCVNHDLDEGQHDITVLATNGAGVQSAPHVRQVVVDRTLPELIFQSPPEAPACGPLPRQPCGSVRFQGTIIDDLCALETLELGLEPVLVGPDGSFDFQSRAQFCGGPNNARFNFSDSAGNEAMAIRYDFVLDGAPPVIDNVVPGPDARVVAQDQLQVRARCVDAESCGAVTVEIDGSPALAQGGDVWSSQVVVPEGRSQVRIRCTDAVGNSTDAVIDLIRDANPPSAQVDAPSPGADVEACVIVRGQMSDGPNGAGLRSVRVNDQEAALDENAGTWILDCLDLPAGGSQLSIVAEDAAGNIADPVLVDVTVRAFGLADPLVTGLAGAGNVGFVGAGDFDEDGRIDLIALAGPGNGPSAVYLQTPEGHFAAVANAGLPINGGVADAAIGDFDGDGSLDVVHVGSGPNRVLLGNGDGTFSAAAPGDLNAGADATGIAVGDFDGDRVLDAILFAGADSQALGGVGDGSFAAAALGVVGLARVVDYQTGRLIDINGDGYPDLAAIGGGAGLFLLSPATRVFGLLDGASFPSQAAGVLAPIDFNVDGRLDLYTSGAAGRFYQNDNVNGDGWTAIAEGAGRAGDAGALVLDATCEGRDGLALYGAGGLRLYRNRAVFGFVPVADAGIPNLGAVSAAWAGDLDGDLDVDLVAGGPGGLSLLRSNGTVVDPQPCRISLGTRRAQAGNAGPADSVGVNVLETAGVNNRMIQLDPAVPTIVTALQGVDLTLIFTNLGAAASNLVDLQNVAPGQSRAPNAPE